MLAQKHAECRGLRRRGLCELCEVAQRKRGVRREQKPELTAAAGYLGADGENDLVALGLRDFIDPSAGHSVGNLTAEGGDGDTVECHRNHPMERTAACGSVRLLCNPDYDLK